MPDNDQVGTRVLAMLWGVAIVVVLYYFGSQMYEFAAAGALEMQSDEGLLSRYARGFVIAGVSFPIAVAYWTALLMLAPSKPFEQLQFPVVVVIAGIMLAFLVLGLAGVSAGGAMAFGYDEPRWIGRVIHSVLTSAVVIACVFMAPAFAAKLARALVTLFAPDEFRHHFTGLFSDDAGPTDSASERQPD